MRTKTITIIIVGWFFVGLCFLFMNWIDKKMDSQVVKVEIPVEKIVEKIIYQPTQVGNFAFTVLDDEQAVDQIKQMFISQIGINPKRFKCYLIEGMSKNPYGFVKTSDNNLWFYCEWENWETLSQSIDVIKYGVVSSDVL